MALTSVAEKRRKQLQERRYAREKAIEETLHIWEKHILPDWKVVNRNPELRKLWWKGIPSKLRGQLWEKAVGNQLALSKGRYILFICAYIPLPMLMCCNILFYLKRTLSDVSISRETSTFCWGLPARDLGCSRTRHQ